MPYTLTLSTRSLIVNILNVMFMKEQCQGVFTIIFPFIRNSNNKLMIIMCRCCVFCSLAKLLWSETILSVISYSYNKSKNLRWERSLSSWKVIECAYSNDSSNSLSSPHLVCLWSMVNPAWVCKWLFFLPININIFQLQPQGFSSVLFQDHIFVFPCALVFWA